MGDIEFNNGPVSQEELNEIKKTFDTESQYASKLAMLRLGTYYGMIFGAELKKGNLTEILKANSDTATFCLFLRSLLEGVFNEVFQDSNSKVDIEIESSLISNPAEFSFTSRVIKK